MLKHYGEQLNPLPAERDDIPYFEIFKNVFRLVYELD